mmetsp:Transcript_82395/g.233675  ORF Transcript_82395/g.233675 Transcript_82395/m.233675 type:complete len:229 (-) Transcript_82395:826-1512(-)
MDVGQGPGHSGPDRRVLLEGSGARPDAGEGPQDRRHVGPQARVRLPGAHVGHGLLEGRRLRDDQDSGRPLPRRAAPDRVRRKSHTLEMQQDKLQAAVGVRLQHGHDKERVRPVPRRAGQDQAGQCAAGVGLCVGQLQPEVVLRREHRQDQAAARDVPGRGGARRRCAAAHVEMQRGRGEPALEFRACRAKYVVLDRLAWLAVLLRPHDAGQLRAKLAGDAVQAPLEYV